MKLSGIIIISSVLLALSLTTTGTYITISDLITPQGNLFNGVILSSLGIITLLLLVIASNLGRAIKTFTEVYAQQMELHKLTTDLAESTKPQPPKDINNIILDALSKLKPGSNVSITNLETGETTQSSFDDLKNMKPISLDSEMMQRINDIFLGNVGQNGFGQFDNKRPTIEELEKKLADAVKNEDFEAAKDIRDQIQLLNNLGGNNEEK